MGDVIKLNGLKYVTSVDNVIDIIRDLIDDTDGQSESIADKQRVHVDMSIYELELLVKEIDRLRNL